MCGRGCPELPLTFLTSRQTVGAAELWLGGAGPIPARIASVCGAVGWRPCWAPAHATLDREDVTAAHAAGLRVVPWTVNEPAAMARLIGWGVDGLCTDFPDLARQAMLAAGLKLPAPYPAAARRL